MGGGRETVPGETEPNQQWWPNVNANVAQIGAEAVANIPTQVHEPGTSLDGAGGAKSAPILLGLQVDISPLPNHHRLQSRRVR